MNMTLTKQSESYTIQETMDNGWEISGNFRIDAGNSNINIDLYITNPTDTQNSEIGNYYWNSNDRINASYNIASGVNEAETIAIFISLIQKTIETYKSM